MLSGVENILHLLNRKIYVFFTATDVYHLLFPTHECIYKLTCSSTPPEPGDNHEHAGGLGHPGCAQKHQRAAEEGEDSSGGRLPKRGKGEVAADPEPVL